jgi:hypothetical protein
MTKHFNPMSDSFDSADDDRFNDQNFTKANPAKSSRPGDEPFTLTGIHMAESEKAVQFEVQTIAGKKLDKPQTEWFPFSQVISQTQAPKESEDLDTLKVKRWILEKKSMI